MTKYELAKSISDFVLSSSEISNILTQYNVQNFKVNTMIDMVTFFDKENGINVLCLDDSSTIHNQTYILVVGIYILRPTTNDGYDINVTPTGADNTFIGIFDKISATIRREIETYIKGGVIVGGSMEKNFQVDIPRASRPLPQANEDIGELITFSLNRKKCVTTH